MNDQTGELYFFKNSRELEELKKKCDALNESLTLLQQAPFEKCPCCKGAGSVQVKTPFYDEQGKIRRFIPCFCTFKGEGDKP